MKSAIFALGSALLAIAATAQTVPRFTADPGPYQVLSIDRLELHDAKRNKDLPIKIYYPQGLPQNSARFPVIIFSHGLYGSKDGYFALGRYWASYGYVSIHPSHADSIRDSGYRGRLMQSIQDPALWIGRPQDISLIISSFAEIERLAPELKGKLDSRRIGVGGHSYGAYTSMAIAGSTVTMPGSSRPTSFADPRVKCVVAMSPQGAGEMGQNQRSWDDIRIPALTIYGSRDMGASRQGPDWRSQPYFHEPAGDKYDVEIEGATHMTFPGPLRQGRQEDDLFRLAKIETLAFWEAYLKPDPAAKKWLQSDAFAKQSGGLAKVAWK
jgi:predicted dienelactone hydrolase